MINALVHAPPLYITNVIRPLASVSQSCTGYYPMCRVCKACPSTASQGDQTLCISNMDVRCSQWGICSLNHYDTTTSQAQPYPIFPKHSPQPAQCIQGIRVYPYAHPQHLKVLKHLHTYAMVGGCSQWVLEPKP